MCERKCKWNTINNRHWFAFLDEIRKRRIKRSKRKRRTGEHLHTKTFCFPHKGEKRGLQKPLIKKAHNREHVHAERVWNTAPRLKIRN